MVGYLVMLCSEAWVVEACCPTTTSILSPASVLFSYFILLTWQKKNNKKKKKTKTPKQVVFYHARYVTALLGGEESDMCWDQQTGGKGLWEVPGMGAGVERTKSFALSSGVDLFELLV